MFDRKNGEGYCIYAYNKQHDILFYFKISKMLKKYDDLRPKPNDKRMNCARQTECV